ncbi:MAG TPA: metallopeptidase TldD-related protein [Gemmatimonadota bacterium]|nr:metallopeptidase TldD-related protein [Gemmatimonadota bacterium]
MMQRRDFVKTGAAVTGGLVLGGHVLGVRGLSAGSPLAPALARSEAVVDPVLREILLEAVEAAMSAGAGYADARAELLLRQSVRTREDHVQGVSESASEGVGVRAFVDGSWGFAATPDMTTDGVVRAARIAAEVAKANAAVKRNGVRLAPVDAYGEVTWTAPHEIDPFSVSVEEKANLLLELNQVAMRREGVRFVSSGVSCYRTDKTLATSEGTVAAQRFMRVDPYMSITAVAPDRSRFQQRGSVVEPSGYGYEYVLANMTPEATEVWADEAVQMLQADTVEAGSWDLVLHPSHLWLTIHESIGHPTELDRALGYEANYAGTSFLAPPSEVLNTFRYGPEFMHIEGERTSAGGMASIGWDDEGVPAQSWPMVENGIFVDYQTTRDQVDWISAYTGRDRSHGCSYASGWDDIQFQRMPNMNLLPNQDEDLGEDDVLAAVDRGIYLEGRNSYSIDQQRYNFQFSAQVAWEVRNGKKTRMLRDVAYQARTPDFWNSLAVIGGPSTYYQGGSLYDGKGQPGQLNAVSHGCPISVFRGVNVLNTGR